MGRAHGLDGSFHVLEPGPALAAAELVIDGVARGVVRRAGTVSRPILRLEGVETRTAAEALGGSELLAPRAAAPVLGEDEYWPEELEGCTVVDGTARVGVVLRLSALPSCEVLEVVRDGGGRDLLVPLVHDAVRSVDVARRVVDIDMAFLGEGPGS